MIQVELEEEMDMPCMCSCGKWFDLHDGYASQKPFNNKVVCEDCHEDELAIVQIQTRIEELNDSGKPHKREIKKLRKQLEDLGISND